MKKTFTLSVLLACLFPVSIFSQWNTSDSGIYYKEGNVGIGLTLPSFPLDVNGDINVKEGSVIRMNNQQVLKVDYVTGNFFSGNGGTSYTSSFHDVPGNTGTGLFSLYSLTKGQFNTANGYRSLGNTTSGKNNTASGYKSLYSNTEGSENTAIANLSLYNNTTGIHNAALGKSALYYNTTGTHNTAIGNFTLYYNTTGEYNSALGIYSGVTTNNLSNATVIGANAVVDASNKVVIGNTSVTSIGGVVNWTVFADDKLKENIKETVPGLQFINLLRPVTYSYTVSKEQKSFDSNYRINWQGQFDIEKINFTGLLAGEVDAAARKVGYDFSGIDKTGSNRGIRYSDFIVPVIKAVQELSAKNIEKDNMLDTLKKDNEELHKQLNNLKSLVQTLQTQVQGGIVAVKKD